MCIKSNAHGVFLCIFNLITLMVHVPGMGTNCTLLYVCQYHHIGMGICRARVFFASLKKQWVQSQSTVIMCIKSNVHGVFLCIFNLVTLIQR